MHAATGPWRQPPEVPDDPKALCLVLLEHRKFGRTFQIMRHVRNKWQFQEGLGMSDQRVVAWALIDRQIEEDAVPEGASVNHGARSDQDR